MGLLSILAWGDRHAPGLSIHLDGRHFAVLEALSRSEDGVCAADAATAIEAAIGREVRLPTVYDTVLDLERLGLIAQSGTSRADTGGRSRRLFRPTDSGRMAMELGHAMARSAEAAKAA